MRGHRPEPNSSLWDARWSVAFGRIGTTDPNLMNAEQKRAAVRCDGSGAPCPCDWCRAIYHGVKPS